MCTGRFSLSKFLVKVNCILNKNKKIKTKKKIVFIFIDKSYAVYHAISLAMQCASDDNFEVTIACSIQNYGLVKKYAASYQIDIKVLRPYWYIALPHYLEIKLQFRKLLFKKYRNYFNSFDLFTCTLYEDILLRQELNSEKDKHFISCNHGVSNTSYSFDDKIKAFDLFYISGQDEYTIRQEKNQLTASNHALIGYLKYELLKDVETENVFSNNKKTVLYNPHWRKDKSSFFKFGFEILDYFVKSETYNLIFAPHSLLGVRNKNLLLKINSYKKYNNIHIDYGSEKCNDFTYVKEADIYLGDVSSQALEFLLFGYRPCLFLDAFDIVRKNKDQVISWELGQVIDSIKEFESSLKDCYVNHASTYKKIQEERIPKMFYQGDKLPSILAKDAILNLIKD